MKKFALVLALAVALVANVAFAGGSCGNNNSNNNAQNQQPAQVVQLSPQPFQAQARQAATPVAFDNTADIIPACSSCQKQASVQKDVQIQKQVVQPQVQKQVVIQKQVVPQQRLTVIPQQQQIVQVPATQQIVQVPAPETIVYQPQTQYMVTQPEQVVTIPSSTVVTQPALVTDCACKQGLLSRLRMRPASSTTITKQVVKSG